MSEKKLVKIKDVHLYTAFNEDVADCYTASKLLKDAGVEFKFLNFADQVDHYTQTLDALSSWPLGVDGHNKKCTNFPILVWDECFDDWSSYRRIAHGLSEIKVCDVLKKTKLL
jgi:hypothetical protein